MKRNEDSSKSLQRIKVAAGIEQAAGGDYLVRHRQPLFILPSWWFWRHSPTARKSAPFVLPLQYVLFVTVLPQLSLPPAGAAVAGAMTVVLSLGLFERFIRWRVKRRRE